MSDVDRESPLSVLGAGAALGGARVAVREVPFLGHLLLRWKGGSAAPDLAPLAPLEAATGLRLPREGGRFTGPAPGPAAIRLSSLRWLIVTDADDVGPWKGRLAAALPAELALFDLTEAFDTFAVEGPCARDLLSAGCPLDLRDTVFPVGAAASSGMAQVGIVLRRTGTLQYRLHVDAGDASHLWRWMQVSIGEFEDVAHDA